MKKKQGRNRRNNNTEAGCDDLLWRILKAHYGHKICIACYGDVGDPADVCLECEDCNEVLLDAEIYTICGKEDI